ncbi:NAD(P)H-dependent oxidoreductase [Nitrosopumilus sp.]|uniref:NADPH-dependent FMN reductase n=1 Tax=Nitrosopumilus sp. TaxID=2024843 RepID=UPI00292F9702|nr:NAD(P)H-dependent oxidoreductase [Nitrosopumilus sp.]
MKSKILAFAGSTRTDSFNKKLVRVAAAGASEAGTDVTVIDLKDFQMPLYDEDLERQEGLPPNTQKLKDLMLAHQGFLISSPEYNSSVSGVLKNTIDWTSRPRNDEPPLVCFQDKIVGLMSASPGALGGLRGLVHVRAILENMGMIVLPSQVAVSKAHEAFDGQGNLNDKKQEQKIKDIGTKLAQMISKLNQ